MQMILPKMRSYWFGDCEGRRCSPAPGDYARLIARVRAIKTEMDHFIPMRREQAISCGFVANDKEYRERLHELCMQMAEEEIARHYQEREAALLQMTRTLDELDEAINLLSERAVEWYGTLNLSFTRKYTRRATKSILARMERETSGALKDLLSNLGGLAETRASLSREVSARAAVVLPNCSALVGGLVAARLLSEAGTLKALARMPSSTLQVLGAKNALFSHIQSGTPAPKHGLLFQHMRVHNAPRNVRGRVARTLAAKLAIATKLDFFRQIGVPEFIEQANRAINQAGDNVGMD